jgi:hypothetical protein
MVGRRIDREWLAELVIATKFHIVVTSLHGLECLLRTCLRLTVS